MAQVRQKTLKHWGNTTDYICGGNTNGKSARDEYLDFVNTNYPEYVELDSWKESFREEPESRNCDKLIIYAWYWRGAWSDPTKEVYKKLYKPKRPTQTLSVHTHQRA